MNPVSYVVIFKFIESSNMIQTGNDNIKLTKQMCSKLPIEYSHSGFFLAEMEQILIVILVLSLSTLNVFAY